MQFSGRLLNKPPTLKGYSSGSQPFLDERPPALRRNPLPPLLDIPSQ